jgi:hypothetical protein
MTKRRIVVIDEFDDNDDNNTYEDKEDEGDKFAWKFVTLLLTLATLALVFADTKLHGSLNKSSIGAFMVDTGLDQLLIWGLEYLSEGKNFIADLLPLHIVEMIHLSTQYILQTVLDLCSPKSVEAVKIFCMDVGQSLTQAINQYL